MKHLFLNQSILAELSDFAKSILSSNQTMAMETSPIQNYCSECANNYQTENTLRSPQKLYCHDCTNCYATHLR